MLEILLLQLKVLQLRLQLAQLPSTPIIRLGGVDKVYNTSTTTAQAYLTANPTYKPVFPKIDISKPDFNDRYYARNEVTGIVTDETQKYFYYLDPNTKIKYTKLISSNPQKDYDWK